MHSRMIRYIWILPAAALLTGCVPSADPEQFGRAYGEQVGVGLPQSASHAVADGAAEGSAGDPATEAPLGAFTEDELAYLTLLFTGAGVPFDLQGLIPADNDGDGVPNIIDDDVDGDGLLNGEDDDIDGDGEPNGSDLDADGDGISNDDDPDIDGDGEPNDEDADDDGDGLSDRWDLNDDGDDEPDDEDEDDDGDEPSDTLEDLVERLRQGLISDEDRYKIAGEIVNRLEGPTQRIAVQVLINDVINLATNPNRAEPPSITPPGINAVDELYRQLADAIDEARKGAVFPKAPLSDFRMQKALGDFVDRGQTMTRLAGDFSTVSLDVVSDQVAELRETFDGGQMRNVAARIDSFINDEARGDAAAEQRELVQITHGAARIGSAFQDEDPDDLLEGVDRLRTLADRLPDEEEREAFYEDLLTSVNDAKEDSPGKSLSDVLDEVEEENDPGDDDPP